MAIAALSLATPLGPARYARAFGLGAPSGIELGGEKPGLIPSPALRRSLGRPWHGGDTVNMSIGQGQVLVTPLQVARMMAAVANGGILWKPRLIQRVERGGRGGQVAAPIAREIYRAIFLEKVAMAHTGTDS